MRRIISALIKKIYTNEMIEKSKIVIIILNFNDFDTTAEYVQSIAGFNSLDHIIVVDNCSSDNSYEKLIKTKFQNVDIIQTDKNRGYSYGNNFGVNYASTHYNPDYFIISNPDISVNEKSIINIVEFLNENENVSSATGLIHDIDGNPAKIIGEKMPSFRDLFSTIEFIIKCLTSKSTFLHYKLEDFDCSNPDVDILPGCFFVIKAVAFKMVNYFDEKTFLYGEERILGFKLRRLGFKQKILLNEKINHCESKTINKIFAKRSISKRIFNNNSKKIYIKYYLKSNYFLQIMFSFFAFLGIIELYLIYVFHKLKNIVRKADKI